MPSQKVDQAQREADGAGAVVGGSEQTPAKDMGTTSSIKESQEAAHGGKGSGKESSPETGRGTERHGSQGPSTGAADVQKNSDKYGNVVGSSEEQEKMKSKL